MRRSHLSKVPLCYERDIDILNPFSESVPLIGRDDDLAFLREWIEGSGIKVATIVGQGGAGKTRLALHFMQQLTCGWAAGFLGGDDAARFAAQQNLYAWRWQCPTLIVIDYASLPFGDGGSAAVIEYYAGWDFQHFAGMDVDYWDSTYYAQFRNYSELQARWLNPDPMTALRTRATRKALTAMPTYSTTRLTWSIQAGSKIAPSLPQMAILTASSMAAGMMGAGAAAAAVPGPIRDQEARAAAVHIQRNLSLSRLPQIAVQLSAFTPVFWAWQI